MSAFSAHNNGRRRFNPLWWILVIVVMAYRFVTKPFPSRCRFHPTCSQYAIDALSQFGATKSLILICFRIAKCNPFHPGGVDKINKV